MSFSYFDGGARRMDGAALRDRIIEEIHGQIADAGSPPVGLATLVVGDDPASAAYVALKHRAAERAGLSVRGETLSDDASPEEVGEVVRQLNRDPAVHGILVQLPLPAHLDEDAVIDLLDPHKDVDGLTPDNLGRLLRGTPRFVPATPLAVLHLLETNGVELPGRHVVVVGRTALVGLPLAVLLASARIGASVTISDPDDPELRQACRMADVLISDASRPHLIGADWVKPGAAVVDIGVSRPEGKLVGDVDTNAVAAVAGALAPNPGGAGPMTVACLLENTWLAARLAGQL